MTEDEAERKRAELRERAGVRVGAPDGWLGIVERLLVDLEDYDLTVDQIKSKFGGLRFYVSGDDCRNPEVDELICKAEIEANSTCEMCGEPGKSVAVSGWVTTLCEKHAKEKGAK